jgi:hypothetical protein
MRSRTASSRSFGYLIVFALALVGALYYRARDEAYVGWFVTAAIFLVISLVMPRLLLPLKRLWLKLGHILHLVVSPIFIGVLYVSSIVSIGLLMKLFGKDGLSLNKSPEASSYWIKRDLAPSRDSLKNQF